jgi:small subunit ribosomal protein S21
MGIKGDERLMRVDVRNNNVDQAIRVLKKKLQNEGLFNELRKREFHETRGEKVRRKKAAGKRRALKALEKRKREQGF